MSESRREWKLPKNIRQVGEGGGERKIYVEDYVVTYLNQLAAEKKQAKALLLGTVKERNLYPYIFIDAAVEVESFQMEAEKKAELETQAEKDFGVRALVGWFFSSDETPFRMRPEVAEIYSREFPGENQVLMIKDAQEEDFLAFLLEDGMVAEQPGYTVYYEKNLAMQAVLIRRNEGKSTETGRQVRDDAIHRFRKLVKEKLSEKERHPAAGKLSWAAGGFLVMTVLALGVTMIYNYDRMRNVEQSLARLTSYGESQAEYVADTVETVEPVMLQMEETEADADVISDWNSASETESDTGTENSTEADNNAETDSQNSEDTDGDTVGSAAQNGTEEGNEAAQNDGDEQSGSTGTDTAQADADEDTALDASAAVSRASYIVKTGDTLADISEMYYGSTEKVEEICSLNGITDENTILPGQKLLLP